MHWNRNRLNQNSVIYSGQNDMISTNLSIEQFLSYISAPLDFERLSRVTGNFRRYLVGEREVMLVWQDDSDWSACRPVIVVKDSNLREFVAFVSTYVKTYTPFSAFFRVVAESKFRELNELLYLNLKEHRPIPHELVGIVIAEAFAQSGDRVTNISSLPIQACLAALSSSILAAISVGYGPASIDEMIDNWGKTKRAISDDNLILPISNIRSFWQIIFAVCVGLDSISESLLPLPVIHAIKSFLDRRELTAHLWHHLCQGNLQLAMLSETFVGSKEDRIAGLDRTVALLQQSTSLNQWMQEMLLGAAASFVANGAMSYLPLTKGFNESYPTATLWFAFFTAFNRRSDVFDSGESLGRHLESKIFITRNFFDSPFADIDFNELQVVGSNSKGMRFRTQQTSSVTVEIIPMVQGRFRIRKGIKPSAATSQPSPISQERWEELRLLTDRISRIVLGQSDRSSMDSEASRRQIAQETRSRNSSSSQSEFFETKPKGVQKNIAKKYTK